MSLLPVAVHEAGQLLPVHQPQAACRHQGLEAGGAGARGQGKWGLHSLLDALWRTGGGGVQA